MLIGEWPIGTAARNRGEWSSYSKPYQCVSSVDLLCAKRAAGSFIALGKTAEQAALLLTGGMLEENEHVYAWTCVERKPRRQFDENTYHTINASHPSEIAQRYQNSQNM
jgi:hypothetical protein